MRSTASLMPRTTGVPANTVGSIAMRAFHVMAGPRVLQNDARAVSDRPVHSRDLPPCRAC